MGVDTKVKLRGKVLPEQALNIIRHNFDPVASMDVKSQSKNTDSWKHLIQEWYDESQQYISTCGFIWFKYKEKNHAIFYDYETINTYENLGYYDPLGLADMVKSETTYLSMSYSDVSVEVLKRIVAEFGGWLDENDCDDVPYYPVQQSEDGSVPPIKVVTMEEIYEKFGCVVVIKK